jgi:methionyl-tRNA formyltransferase
MRIILVTQDSPFYLAENIDYFIRNLPGHSGIVGCVLLAASPFGRKETTFEKVKRTYCVFGLRFFLRSAAGFLAGKILPSRSVVHALRKHRVPIIELKKSINSRASLEVIRRYSPDLIISIQANTLFKKSLMDLPARGCLNVHTALLPKYRGLMPTFWVLKNDEQVTGVSVFFIDEGIDSGPILVQKRIGVENRSLDQLIRETKKLGMDALLEAVDLTERGGYDLIENDDSQQTYFSFPTRQDVQEFLAKGKKFF